MAAEQTIAEIERLERIFAVPDTRPLTTIDISAANGFHDAKLAHSPKFHMLPPGTSGTPTAGSKQLNHPLAEVEGT